MSDDKKNPKKKPTDEEAKKALEHDLEFLRRRAADARQRGDIEKAKKLEKGIVLIERGAKRRR